MKTDNLHRLQAIMEREIPIMLRRWNKGRILLKGVIESDAELAAAFTGMYVALADQPAYIRKP